ncbi:MAG: glycosyltransferase [Pseudomonadota bacterium]
MSALRVLHVGKYFPPVPGGIETFCGDLFEAFAATDVKCAMLVHRKDGVPFPASPHLTGVTTRGEALFTPLAPGFPAAIRRQLKSFEPHLLHLHLPNPAAFTVLAMRAARGIPWVINWHSDVVASQYQWRLRVATPPYRLLESATLRRAAAVVAASHAYAAGSDVLSRLDPEKLHVIPFGIDPARLTQRVPVTWPSAGLKLAAVGRLTYYKGFDRLLEAMTSIPEASLVLVGDGQERGRLETLIATLGLQDRVRMIHDADDALRNSVIAEADCLCLPSIERTEAFGIVLVEAMALGTPVIATNLPGSGVPYVVDRGGHGLLAEPDNVPSLVERLKEIAGSSSLREQFSQQARANFPQFHIDQTVERFAELYRQLC